MNRASQGSMNYTSYILLTKTDRKAKIAFLEKYPIIFSSDLVLLTEGLRLRAEEEI